MDETNEEQGTKVQVYVYDISHGLARVYSRAIVGIDMDAIYHTSVVMGGKEYYFDREGATISQAGKTRFGVPMEVLELGETFIPGEILGEYLDDLKQNRFKFGSYNLFHNNCNHFTHELLQFLNGTELEKRILHLPEQVLSSPNGALIQQMFNGGIMM
ncbi:unnamed protein product [Cyberlindnera jadinii]|uniref:DUF862-domain-containing protein n=1 Tax=Cyberlindnera jadinii (strain ATCC 18201 / CBS 1600 / BCRC 20928 / JCM 3617 / NBRC 0987 / NRRL Y-1542) TaxID=983966 RepID=A0A0H5CD59_CYBJN|nr:DUF862-domain-containing protein [Cyberlindnera jadinii NRRL Y-1542]ODV75420.1 DUF862-domain-containing protein [Cyberlindnera jadinii NRRL Y-1542]CEP22559.1 unnamed protein product [Cyberlindnera jadinii]